MDILTILFLVLTVLQFVFWIILVIAAGQEPFYTRDIIDFPVSVIVAAHNAKQDLNKLMEELNRQQYANYEVIIVNDRSNDGTREFLEEKKKDFSWLRIVHVDETPNNLDPKKYALTLGIKSARNEIILLTDSDCIPSSPHWISGMVSGFTEEKKIVLGFSFYEKQPGLLNYFIRFETLFTGLQYLGSALLGNPYMGVGRNLAYKRSFFKGVNGFKDYFNVTGGDDDLFVNKNASGSNTGVVMGKDYLTSSKPKTTVREFLQQKFRHLSVGKFYRKKDKLILGVFNFSYLGSVLVIVFLIIKTPALIWLASFLLVRWLLMMIVIGRWSRVLGCSFNLIGVPLLDILYLFYYIFTGTKVLFIKKVKWT